MSWSLAVGVLSTALRMAPVQTAPQPPSPPPVIVTVPDTVAVPVPTTVPIPTAVTVPNTEVLPEGSLTVPLTTSDAPTGTATSQPAPDAEPAAQGPGSGDPASTSGPRPALSPAPNSTAPHATPRAASARPLDHRSSPRLVAAAREAAGDFLPAEALALLAGLFLVANGVTRRRDELAHVQLDDRDAIVRFE